jgi:hypothetical protein
MGKTLNLSWGVLPLTSLIETTRNAHWHPPPPDSDLAHSVLARLDTHYFERHRAARDQHVIIRFITW